MNKKLVPNYGQAILKPVEETEQRYNNIIIPDIGNQKLTQAEIIDITAIYNFNLGEFAPLMFKIGDLVVIPPMGSQRVIVDKEEYLICSITDLLAKIE